MLFLILDDNRDIFHIYIYIYIYIERERERERESLIGSSHACFVLIFFRNQHFTFSVQII
jgi:hypothetical protein